MITLADRFTLARLGLAPLATAAYLALPQPWCWWVAGLICGAAEFTDYVDGRVARARREVSDFGKLADPFCDVFYRICLFLVLLLPAAGGGYHTETAPLPWLMPLAFPMPGAAHPSAIALGLMPFIPVLLMTLREVVAGALRSMCATKGLVLAARTSGKVKAWFQGVCIITALGLPAIFGQAAWHLWFNSLLCWVCALLSVGSMAEYIWVNRGTLAQLVERRQGPGPE